MNQSSTTLNLPKAARVAGIAYLIIIVAGIYAQFFVRSSLIAPGDAATTAANITASESLFRTGIAADLVMLIADVALAMLFYVLLKPVSKALALAAAFFRLAQAATLGVNLLNLFFALQLLSGATYLSVLGAEQVQALALLFLDLHGIGYTLGLVFFGASLLILGYLVYRSGYFPRILGILLVLASFGYLADTFAKTLLTNYAAYQPFFDTVVFGPAVIAELAMALWLLVKAVTLPQQDNEAIAAPQMQLSAER